MKVKREVLAIILVMCLMFVPGRVSSQTAKINWNNNSEEDLAGYHVYFGTASGNYQYNLNVGLNKPVYIKGLQEGISYYFAVTAFDWSFKESDLSEEVRVITSSNPPQDDLINVAIQPSEAVYQLGTYKPYSSLALENELFGIRIYLPAGAADGILPVAAGGFCSNRQAYFDIDLAPDGFVLKKQATVTIEGDFSGKNILVQKYGDDFSSLISNFSINETSLTFSLQTLGKVRIYTDLEAQDEMDPSSEQLGNKDASSGSSGNGGGGGGCFMDISCSSGGASGFILLLAILLIANIMYIRPLLNE